MKAEQLAKEFHNIYEALAPEFGYETREETREFDKESKNGRLMIAVCGVILHLHKPKAPLDSKEAWGKVGRVFNDGPAPITTEKCEHGRGLTDYCQPCDRISGG